MNNGIGRMGRKTGWPKALKTDKVFLGMMRKIGAIKGGQGWGRKT